MSMIGHLVITDASRFLAAEHDDETFGALLEEAESSTDSHLDIGKAWHAIHFLLTGTEWDTKGIGGLAILGGREIGEDQGYGPARLLTPDQVRQTADALSTLSIPELMKKYRGKVFNASQIYPQSWSDDSADVTYIESNFLAVVSFYRKAAQEGMSILLYLS